MNVFKKLSAALFILFLLLAMPVSVFADASTPTPTPTESAPAPATSIQVISGDKTVVGDNFVLTKGQELQGDMVVFGGMATIEDGAVVNGSLTIFGGEVNLDGTVKGDIAIFGGRLDMTGTAGKDVSAFGGDINLHGNALVHGDVNAVGVKFNRSENAKVEGKVNTENPSNFTIPQVASPNTPAIPAAPAMPLNTATRVLVISLQAVVLAALAAVLILALPKQTLQASDTLTHQTWMSALVGLISVIAYPFAIVVLALLCATIILIPVSILGIVALSLGLGLFAFLGWITAGYTLGRVFAKAINQVWPAPVIAGVGTLAMTFVVRLLELIPCVGWVAECLVVIFGLGAILMMLFAPRKVQPLPIFPAAPAQPTQSIPPAEPPASTAS
jgi:hypothetical protein